MTALARIGFMQGRLSAMVDGKIQAFPWNEWREEFSRAKALGLTRMEWTIDQDRLRENPLTTAAGRADIAALCASEWRANSKPHRRLLHAGAVLEGRAARRRTSLIDDLDLLLEACRRSRHRIRRDPAGRQRQDRDARRRRDTLLRVLLDRAALAVEAGRQDRVRIRSAARASLRAFIARLPRENFGINYDIGNSASLGYDPAEEIAAYAPRILNVHVKDRLRGGTTVPLGTGAAELAKAIRADRAIRLSRPVHPADRARRPTATMPARSRSIAT